MFSRRGFIRIGAASVGSLALRPLGLLPGLAQSGPGYRALVCVFLFGGNDSNNMVIPMDDAHFKAYSTLRGTLALPQSLLTAPATSLSGEPYSFHGKLAELASLFQSKELAVVANVGSLVQPLTKTQYQQQQAPVPSNLFSHSDQQLEWQTSLAQGRGSTGWAGRAADYIATQNYNNPNFPAFLSVAGNSLLGTGATTQPIALSPGGSLALTGFNTTTESQTRFNALQTLLSTNSGLSLVQAADDTLSHSIQDANALGTALSKATAFSNFPNTGLGAQLKQVAQIIQVQGSLGMRRQIFFCSLGGFDTHTNQLNQHNTLFPQLSMALSAFHDTLQQIGMADSVTTFTESDFSRTFQQTSGDGSDHAWGSHQIVMGGAVRGGDVYGRFPTFAFGGPDDTDTRGRWIPTTSVDQLGATLCSWFGIPDGALAAVFPNLVNFSTTKLAFLG